MRFNFKCHIFWLVFFWCSSNCLCPCRLDCFFCWFLFLWSSQLSSVLFFPLAQHLPQPPWFFVLLIACSVDYFFCKGFNFPLSFLSNSIASAYTEHPCFIFVCAQASQISDSHSDHFLYAGHRRSCASAGAIDKRLRLVNPAHFVLENMGFTNLPSQQSPWDTHYWLSIKTLLSKEAWAHGGEAQHAEATAYHSKSGPGWIFTI